MTNNYNIPQVEDVNLVVQDSIGNMVETQYVELDKVTKNLRNFYAKAYFGSPPKYEPKYWLIFQASVPPLGWNTYFISKSAGKGTFPKYSCIDMFCYILYLRCYYFLCANINLKLVGVY